MSKTVKYFTDRGTLAVSNTTTPLVEGTSGESTVTTGPGFNPDIVSPVYDSDGNTCFPSRYSHTLTYNSDGTPATDAFTDGSHTWTTTYTYTNGMPTTISAWVKS